MYCTVKYMDFSKIFSNAITFDWDNGNLEHTKKHGFSYKECEQIFYNKPILISPDEIHSGIEQRFRVLGKTKLDRLTVLVFTLRWGKIRVISARDQNKKEKLIYKNEEVKQNG